MKCENIDKEATLLHPKHARCLTNIITFERKIPIFETEFKRNLSLINILKK